MSILFYVSYAALWLLLLTIGVLVLLLYRHFGVMSLGTLEGVQRDGLPIGSAAPPISGVTAAGPDTSWQPQRGQPQLLLFAAPDCELFCVHWDGAPEDAWLSGRGAQQELVSQLVARGWTHRIHHTDEGFLLDTVTRGSA